MNDLDITKFSSIALKMASVTNPYTGKAPSDGTLALGSVSNTDVINNNTNKTILNNPNYDQNVAPTAKADNFPVKDGTIVYNRDIRATQVFIDGVAISLNVGVTNFNLVTPVVGIKAGNALTFQTDGNGTDLVASAIPSIVSGIGALNGKTAVIIPVATVAETSKIFITPQLFGGDIGDVANTGVVRVGAIVANTSFSVYSTVDTDKAQFSWMIIT